MLPRTFGHKVEVPKNMKSLFNSLSYLQVCITSPENSKCIHKYEKNIITIYRKRQAHIMIFFPIVMAAI